MDRGEQFSGAATAGTSVEGFASSIPSMACDGPEAPDSASTGEVLRRSGSSKPNLSFVTALALATTSSFNTYSAFIMTSGVDGY